MTSETENPAAGDRIVVAGASGFVGRYLVQHLRAEGAAITTIGRRDADVRWGDADRIRAAVDGADLLINLAGRSVNARYNERTKADIFSSRLLTTAELGRAVEQSDAPPPVWMNASTATIYRHADDRPMTESGGQIGEGFSVNVATAWEREFFAHERPETRQVALRMAIVLGDGSALAPLAGLTRVGFGGPQIGGRTRGGRQMFSWVHLADVLGAVRFLRTHELEGPVNIAAPNPVTNRELMATLRRVLGVPVGIPLLRWMLEVGAVALRTETELLLKSRWVLPERLQAAGYEFEYPALEAALRSILR
ncbi:hypothetical protein CLV46_1568 [Diaminobutyricimonas aerilata]|uniref:DUF1731 domain-containing protein n=1 Tax=Diaminobutyricimonas aerilata TaxID=1162967 RepID=A0A2M9CJI3_9MICO|nr:TIGR01777 family oxidoreductase [Diaminobutyricimonas aerilata]PJJ72008.1 hypothetical protein CLV46_1568 [Diaminobutyricimonas aerilata]